MKIFSRKEPLSSPFLIRSLKKMMVMMVRAAALALFYVQEIAQWPKTA
jgi:hypothetical protein